MSLKEGMFFCEETTSIFLGHNIYFKPKLLHTFLTILNMAADVILNLKTSNLTNTIIKQQLE